MSTEAAEIPIIAGKSVSPMSPHFGTTLNKMFDGLQGIKPAETVDEPAAPKEQPTKTSEPKSEEKPKEQPAAKPVEEKSVAAPEVKAEESTQASAPADADEPEEIADARKQLENPHLNKRQRKPYELMLEHRAERIKVEKESKAEVTRLQRELEEAKRAGTSTADYVKIKQDLNEAIAARDQLSAVVEMEHDPRFVQKYESRTTTLNGVIENALKGIGVQEASHKIEIDGQKVEAFSIANLRANGGLARLAATNPKAYTEVLNYVKERNPVAASIIEMNVAQLSQVEFEREQEISNIRKNSQQYHENRRNQTEQQRKMQEQAQAQQQQTITEALRKNREETYAKEEGFKIEAIPENASADQKARIERRNAAATKSRETLANIHQGMFFGAKNVNDLLDGAKRAALYDITSSDLADARKEAKDWQNKYESLQKSRMPKGDNSITPTPQVRQTSPSAPAKDGKGARGLAESILDATQRTANERAQRESGNLSR